MGDWFQDPVDSKIQGCSKAVLHSGEVLSILAVCGLGLLESTDGGMEGQLQWVKCF